MKRDLTIALIVLFLLSGIRLFAQDGIIKENRPVSSFSGIKVSGVAHVYLRKADKENVNIEINKEYNDRLIVEVIDNILVIRMRQVEGNNHLNRLDLKINVDYKDLNSIGASGVTHVYSQNAIESEKLSLDFSGVCKAKLEVLAKEVDLKASGTSDITLSGKADALNTKSSGASNIRAYDLAAGEVDSEASGASNIYVAAAKTLSTKASGASAINYKGNPQVTNNQTSIAAKVRKM